MFGFLTKGQVVAYKQKHKTYRKDQKNSDKIKAILMLNDGYRYEEIARILFIDDVTVRRWKKQYKTFGLDALLANNYLGGESKLSIEQAKQLTVHLQEKIYLSAKEIAHYVSVKYEATYTVKGMTSMLHRLGFTYKKPKHIPGKANKKAQEAFIETYKELKENKHRQDHIYFMDGVHPLHNSQPAFGWIEKGKEQTLKTNTGRQRININGAYDIEDKEVIIREDESINAQSTIKLFEQLSKRQQPGIIYIIADNAKYYKCKLVNEYLSDNPRIKMIYLPPYSPNLNIIERLWRFFKKKITYNKYYEKFSVFKENCLDFFENIEQYKDELDSLMTDNFQVIQA